MIDELIMSVLVESTPVKILIMDDLVTDQKSPFKPQTPPSYGLNN